MNEEQLQAMEARCNAATMGPWLVVERGGDDCGYDIAPTCPGLRGQFERVEDARFVAHARQDIPALIAEVRDLQRQARLRESLASADATLIAEVRDLQQRLVQLATGRGRIHEGGIGDSQRTASGD